MKAEDNQGVGPRTHREQEEPATARLLESARHAATSSVALPRLAPDGGRLTAAQADGLACVACGADYLRDTMPHTPANRSHTGSQVFAGTLHAGQTVA